MRNEPKREQFNSNANASGINRKKEEPEKLSKGVESFFRHPRRGSHLSKMARKYAEEGRKGTTSHLKVMAPKEQGKKAVRGGRSER